MHPLSLAPCSFPAPSTNVLERLTTTQLPAIRGVGACMAFNTCVVDPCERNNTELGNAQYRLLRAISVSFNEVVSLQNLSLRVGKSTAFVYNIPSRGVVVDLDACCNTANAHMLGCQTCLRKPRDIEYCSEDKLAGGCTFIDLSFVRSLSFVVGNRVKQGRRHVVFLSCPNVLATSRSSCETFRACDERNTQDNEVYTF